MNSEELLYYKRQICLSDVGEKGQQKLKNAIVLVIGCGGLGCPVLQYLVAAGVGTLGLCDYDEVDITNLHRQVLFGPADVGQNKAVVAKSRLEKQNPHIKLNLFQEQIDLNNIEDIFSKFDIIVDCTDNFKTKFMIHDFSFYLKKKLIQASIYQFEGQIQVFKYDELESNRPCFRCLWPKIPAADCVGSCKDVGVFGVVPGVLGSLQANEVIKSILGINGIEPGISLIFDLKSMEMRKLKWKKKEACCLCSSSLEFNDFIAKEYINEFEISYKELLEKNFELIDIREDCELKEFGQLDQIHFSHLPMTEISQWLDKLKKESTYVFMCQKGVRSLRLAKDMKEKGHKTLSLINGFSQF